jgi:hypothetical protein
VRAEGDVSIWAEPELGRDYSQSTPLSLLKTRSGATGHRVAVVAKVDAAELGCSSEPKQTPLTLNALRLVGPIVWRRILRGAAFVTVVKATEVGNRYDARSVP